MIMDEASQSLTIIVPVLNEADSVASFLRQLRTSCRQRPEIIVADGGSRDETVALARPLCDCVVEAGKGRALQMNAGARRASGDILWFVHSDSRLPPQADQIILDALAAGSGRWGRFDIQLSGGLPMLRVVERMMNWRSRLTGIATGDQGLFVARELFESIGGFPEIALMEDIAISRKLKSSGPPLCLPQHLITSSRRWERDGVLRTILLMWQLRLLYFLGADPAGLARKYYGDGH